MELAAHWHRRQNLPKKRVNTSLVYRERDDPVKDRFGEGCVSFFCAVRMLEQARGKGVSSPAILSLGTPSLLACRLGYRRNR